MSRFPEPVLEEVGELVVVRDDLLAGGTKRRVIDYLLDAGDSFVYASPAYGYAQVALALACRDRAKNAIIFTAKRGELHPRTKEAMAAGARVILVPYGYLSNVQAKATAYAASAGATLLPFGLDTPEVRRGLTDVARSLSIRPAEVWTVAGSGTLSRALQDAWPQATFYAVRVGAEPSVGRAQLHRAPEPFDRDAQLRPPFPSCANYDAKAWRFVRELASPGALFWNVAA